jgi:hypothetical protein
VSVTFFAEETELVSLAFDPILAVPVPVEETSVAVPDAEERAVVAARAGELTACMTGRGHGQ